MSILEGYPLSEDLVGSGGGRGGGRKEEKQESSHNASLWLSCRMSGYTHMDRGVYLCQKGPGRGWSPDQRHLLPSSIPPLKLGKMGEEEEVIPCTFAPPRKTTAYLNLHTPPFTRRSYIDFYLRMCII